MKQILLIGDSIRMGYCEHVKRLFADRAEVVYPSGNCRATQHVLTDLYDWSRLCDEKRVEIVHFNCGQWDVSHFNEDPEPLTSIEEYKKNLLAIIRTLKKFFPGARLIFATTTPMNPEHPETRNPRTNEDIIRYNNIAKSVMQEMGVAVNDLFAFCEAWNADRYIDYVHLTDEGYKMLGKRVYDFIVAEDRE